MLRTIFEIGYDGQVIAEYDLARERTLATLTEGCGGSGYIPSPVCELLDSYDFFDPVGGPLAPADAASQAGTLSVSVGLLDGEEPSGDVAAWPSHGVRHLPTHDSVEPYASKRDTHLYTNKRR